MNVRLGRNALIALTALLLLLSGGCIVEEGDEIDPRPGSGDLSISILNESTAGSSYDATIEVIFEWHVEDRRQFDDVVLCAYDANGTVQTSEDLGSFSSRGTDL